MQPPVGFKLELTSDQVTRLVREVLTFNLCSCKTIESRNILRKAILLLSAQDDSYWISETYSTSSTQTNSCSEDNDDDCIIIKQEKCEEEEEFHIHNTEDVVGEETQPSARRKRNTSPSNNIRSGTFTQSQNVSLLDNYTQVPLWRTGRRAQPCGSDEWESSIFMDGNTNEFTEDANSMIVFEMTSCSSDYKDVATHTKPAYSEDAALGLHEKETDPSLEAGKQGSNFSALMKPPERNIRHTSSHIPIPNPVYLISQHKNNTTHGNILPGIISAVPKTTAKSTERSVSVELNLARPLTAASMNINENEKGHRKMFQDSHLLRDEGNQTSMEDSVNYRNQQETMVYDQITNKQGWIRNEEALDNVTDVRIHMDMNEELFDEKIHRVTLKPGSMNIAHINLHDINACKRTFSKMDDIIAQMGSHTSERTFECTTCKRSFSEYTHLARHNKIHTRKHYKCSTCDRVFLRQMELIRHTRIHTGEKPFKCTTCGKAFSQKVNLIVHTRTHTGEKPFKCTTCTRAFSQHVHLIKHIRIHTQEYTAH